MRRVDADDLIVRLQALYVSAVCIGGDHESAQYILKAVEEVAKAPTISDEELRREAEWNYNKGFKEGYTTALDVVKETMRELIEEAGDDHEE